MTILFDKITDVAGADEYTPLVFWAPDLRENDSLDGMVTPKRHYVHAVDGAFTTPDLDVGPCMVQIGMMQYAFTVPQSSAPVRLWPLVDAGMPQPPVGSPGFIRNGGGVAIAKAVTAAQYATLTVDPATLYVIVEEETP
ncbi:hypothetical protein JVX90_00350 [Gordonia sp. PDNC005]|uniref:hypothetical protein n=1 Tax=Gordonia sp. PDNC005 TaxID=2811424 RepID=UPI0019649CA2|nr:hypothetical protein [Gordonia sp. PDNC005]QRY62763.1 hypothetical protein JVX90_00350 [Gordonia sp. PDNC005]